MNAHMVCVALSVSLLVSATVHAFQAVAKDPSANADAVITAADLVQAALQAEAAGDAAKRESLLREALDNDPEYAPARWHSGYVRLNDKWVSLTESQNAFRLDPRVTDYRVVRESLVESPTQDLLLARWCQDNKLTEEAHFHWLNVLRVQPNHEEALSALDVQWYNGRLLKRDQVAEQKRKTSRPPGVTRQATHANAAGKSRSRAGSEQPARATATCSRGWRGIWPRKSPRAPFPCSTSYWASAARLPRIPSAADRQPELAEDPREEPRPYEVPGAARHWPPHGSSANRSSRRTEKATSRGLRALTADLCPLPRRIRV